MIFLDSNYNIVMTRRILLFLFISFLSTEKSFATPPSYYSYFYSGIVLLRGQTDTIRGLILLEPLSYIDTVSYERIYEKEKGYAVVFPVDGNGYSPKRPIFIKLKQILFARLFYKVLYPNPDDTTNNCSLNYSPGLVYKKYQKVRKIGTIKEYYTDYKSFVYNNDTLLLRLLNSGKVDVYDEFQNPEKNITAPYTLDRFLTPIYSSLFRRIGIFVCKNNMLEKIKGHMEFNFNFQRTRFVFKYLNKRYNTQFKRKQFITDRQMFAYIAEHG